MQQLGSVDNWSQNADVARLVRAIHGSRGQPRGQAVGAGRGLSHELSTDPIV